MLILFLRKITPHNQIKERVPPVGVRRSPQTDQKNERHTGYSAGNISCMDDNALAILLSLRDICVAVKTVHPNRGYLTDEEMESFNDAISSVEELCSDTARMFTSDWRSSLLVALYDGAEMRAIQRALYEKEG